MSDITLTPKQVTEFLGYCIKAKRNAFLWGPPGVGKTATVEQVARDLGVPITTKIAAQMDATDVAGLPFIEKRQSHWARAGWLPSKGPHIVFLDEFPNASTLVWNSLQKLINEGEVNDYKVPDGVVFIAAGNNVGDRAGANRTTSAINSRFIHANFAPDLKDWCEWAVANDIHPMVIAFLRYRPELFHKFNKDAREFPCPRTWQFVSQIAHQEPSAQVALALYAGTVGHAAAIEFLAFMRLYKSLPSIDAILLDPAKADVPKDVSGLYAVASALGHRADPRNLGRVTKYLDRLPDEYNVLAMRDATTRNAELTATPEFTKWSVKHQDVTG